MGPEDVAASLIDLRLHLAHWLAPWRSRAVPRTPHGSALAIPIRVAPATGRP
jgi:hypothetical protein